ncbi:MAG: hypothetical protein CM15mV57_140 [uncultured marine virus]|nr:MAG: hypothetical protein CM15mV57_140 [uncultured marine virus]
MKSQNADSERGKRNDLRRVLVFLSRHRDYPYRSQAYSKGGQTMKCKCGNEIHPRTGMGMPGALYDHLCSPCADAERWEFLIKETELRKEASQ